MKTATHCPVVMTRFAHGRKDTMNIRTEKFPRPPDQRETAAPDGTGHGGKNNLHTDYANRNTNDTQRAGRAISAGLIALPDARDLALILKPLDLPQRIWLTAGGMWSLPPVIAGQLAHATYIDVIAAHSGPITAEAERMRRQWVKHCGDPKRRARR